MRKLVVFLLLVSGLLAFVVHYLDSRNERSGMRRMPPGERSKLEAAGVAGQ